MENERTNNFDSNLKLFISFPSDETPKNEQEMVKKAQEIWRAQNSEENWIRGLNLQDIQTKLRQARTSVEMDKTLQIALGPKCH